ncbi:MAG: hypothetical protein D6744_00090 [Planctomycetota bacterium]|nr:MAG: hypothetical protein D6744_00090 [Planctomycetota bacterium]
MRCASAALWVAVWSTPLLPAATIIENGSFETGDTSGWTAFGNVFVRDREQPRDFLPPQAPDWTATDGTLFASLWSTDNAGGPPIATLHQSFDAPAGAFLFFDYFFDYGDAPPNRDVATGELFLPNNQVVTLFEHNSTGHELPAGANVGWTTVFYELPFTGRYTLSFVLTDADGDFESLLGVDNVSVVPEPASALGLLPLAGLLRRRRR